MKAGFSSIKVAIRLRSRGEINLRWNPIQEPDLLAFLSRDLLVIVQLLSSREAEIRHCQLPCEKPHWKIVKQAIRKAFTSQIGPYHSASPRTQVTSIHVRVKHFVFSIQEPEASKLVPKGGLMKIVNSGHTRGGRPKPRIDRNRNESIINRK